MKYRRFLLNFGFKNVGSKPIKSDVKDCREKPEPTPRLFHQTGGGENNKNVSGANSLPALCQLPFNISHDIYQPFKAC